MIEYVILFGCSYFLYVEMESIFFFFCIEGKPDTDEPYLSILTITYMIICMNFPQLVDDNTNFLTFSVENLFLITYLFFENPTQIMIFY